jgi:lipopolysaccharide transport system ATP-binding protein
MMNDIAIKVQNISKKYRIGSIEENHDTLLEKIIYSIKSPIRNFSNLKNLSRFSESYENDVIWALKDISFEVNRGEVFGIIGANGSGKSTLLKLLSRITMPTSGRAEINGRIASLLEVGTGFHPELTGRENVYLNGTILGMTKAEVKSKFDQIVDFSGIGKFIDTPIKRYSSGMSVRLAFSVAAFLEPEILLIDEVLAVGDIQFQKQCLDQVDSISKSGRTVLLVSHNMTAISSICKRSMLIDKGKVHSIGYSNDIVANYNKTVLGNLGENSNGTFELINKKRSSDEYGKNLKIEKLVLCNNKNEPSNEFHTGDKLILKLFINKKNEFVPGVHYTITFKDSMSNRLASINTQMLGKSIDIKEDKGIIKFTIEKIPFTDIRLYIDINISQPATKCFDEIKNAASIQILKSDVYGFGYSYDKWFGITAFDSFDIKLVG